MGICAVLALGCDEQCCYEQLCRCLFREHMHTFLLGLSIVIKLLDYRLCIYRALVEAARKISKAIIPLYIPVSNI